MKSETGNQDQDQDPWFCLQQDVERYGGWSALLREQSLWAVIWYRIGSRLSLVRLGVLRKTLLLFWWPGFRVIETFTGVSIPVGAKIGGGLRIWHFGGVFVNSGAIIGPNCTLRQGVTIGNRSDGGGAPVIGRGVELGAYAQVLGKIEIGDYAKVGAMSLVITDVPAGYTAVGIPARCRPPASSSSRSNAGNHYES